MPLLARPRSLAIRRCNLCRNAQHVSIIWPIRPHLALTLRWPNLTFNASLPSVYISLNFFHGRYDFTHRSLSRISHRISHSSKPASMKSARYWTIFNSSSLRVRMAILLTLLATAISLLSVDGSGVICDDLPSGDCVPNLHQIWFFLVVIVVLLLSSNSLSLDITHLVRAGRRCSGHAAGGQKI